MNICVYCGSGNGNIPKIPGTAKLFGIELAEKGYGLVYGGSSIGIMGTVANAVMQNGGEVTGVIPKDLFKKEVAHTGITRLITVDDMHERKSKMAELADAFVALPGGFGTMEELFEIITWNQLSIINKPVTILNIDGYYDPLISMINHAIDTGFIRNPEAANLRVTDSIEESLNYD